jgi:hypothetical protein
MGMKFLWILWILRLGLIFTFRIIWAVLTISPSAMGALVVATVLGYFYFFFSVETL